MSWIARCTEHHGREALPTSDSLLMCSAMQDYDEALSLDGSSVLALLRKGKALWALKKPKVMLGCFTACTCGQQHCVHTARIVKPRYL